MLLTILVPLTIVARPIAFMNVNVVPMDRNVVLADQIVVTRGERITAIGSASQTAVPADAIRIDGKGKFLMPGLVDMHVHLYAAQEFALYLGNGVTTVYNLNGRPGHLRWRDNIAKGKMVGPTIFTCGPTITECENAEQARKTVDSQAKAGYDAIKIYNGVSSAAYPALIEAAKKHRMMYVGHIPRGPGLEGVLKAGMPIAHAEEYLYTYLNGPQDVPSAIKKAALMTVEAKVPITATLVTFDRIIQQAVDLPAVLSKPETKYLSAWDLRTWQPGRNTYEQRFKNPDIQARLKNGLEVQKELLRQIHKAGGTVLVGTDANCTGVLPGFSLAEEVRNLGSIGFTNYRALRAATLDPATVLGRDQEFGTVAQGMRADVILLDANPLADLENLNRIGGVMARGRWHSRQDLGRGLSEVAKRYRDSFSKATTLLSRDPKGLTKFLGESDPMGRMTTSLFVAYLKSNGAHSYLPLLERLRKEDATGMGSEEFVNELGYSLMRTEKEVDLAVAVFEANAKCHPNSANALDSLAESYLEKGDKQKAIDTYKRALKIDPNLQSSRDMLKKLGG